MSYNTAYTIYTRPYWIDQPAEGMKERESEREKREKREGFGGDRRDWAHIRMVDRSVYFNVVLGVR